MSVLSDHLDTIITGLNQAASGTTEALIVRDRPAMNVRDWIVNQVDALVSAEDWSDLPS